MEKLNSWSANIIKHFWDCCRTCEGDPMKLKVKKLLPTNRIVVYQKGEMVIIMSTLLETGDCTLTDGPTDPDGRPLEYFTCQEPAFCALQKITMDQHWLKSRKFYTNSGDYC